MIGKDRRKTENAALRALIDALKEFISARDALWSLGYFDRLFRFEKCRKIINDYDLAAHRVRGAVREVIEVTAQRGARQEEAGEKQEPAPVAAPLPLVTAEEFEALLGMPGSRNPGNVYLSPQKTARSPVRRAAKAR